MFVMSVVTQLPAQCSYMQPNNHVDIRPPRRVIVDPLIEEKDKFHPAMAAEMLPELPLMTREKFAKANSIIESRLSKLGDVPNAGDELVVIPLGTNSAISSRYRNGDFSDCPFPSAVDIQTVSGQFIQIPDWGNLLLDAGEGTWGQMARYFGTDPARPSNVWQALREVKCIFISHAHADHHAGLAKILAMRKKVHRYVLSCQCRQHLTSARTARPSTHRAPLPCLDLTYTLVPARSCPLGRPWFI
jgi:ribonuclease Z